MDDSSTRSEMKEADELRLIEARASQLRSGYESRLGALHDAIATAPPAGLVGGSFAAGFLTDRLIAGGGDIEKALSAADMVMAFTKGFGGPPK